MTSLTQVAITARKIIRYSIYLVIFSIIAWILIDVGKKIFLQVFPPAPPPPTVAFSRLPALPFPENKGLPELSYQVETAQGDLPTLPEQAKVYFMPKFSPHLFSLDSAKNKAGGLGFINEPEQISDTVYGFKHPQTPAVLTMNIVSQTFSISYDLASDPSPLSFRPPAPEVAAANIRSYLSSANLLPADLTGPVSHEFLKVEGQSLTDALSLSEASLVKVNLFRKGYDNLPSMTNNPSQANVWFIVSGEQNRQKQMVGAEFHYFPVDESQSATYPLKTSQEALQELVDGKGFIADLGLNQDGKITIRKIYLGYYDPGEQIQFYQPIIVFEGDRGFIAYVSAVTAEYYGE